MVLPIADRTGQFSAKLLFDLRRFAGGMAGIAVLSLVLMQVDKLLLSKLLPLSEFAVYALASSAASTLMMLVAPVAMAAYPKLCRFHACGDLEAFGETFHDASQLVTTVVGGAALTIIVFAPSILLIWTRNQSLSAQAADLLRWLALGTLLNSLMWIPYHAQLAYGWTSLTIRINVVAVVILIPLLWILVHRFGAIGAAWCWTGLNAGYVLIGAQLMFRRILSSERRTWYWLDTLRPLIYSTLAILILDRVWVDSHVRVISALRVAIALGTCVFVSALAAPRIRHRCISLLRQTSLGVRGGGR
jgi:O-antigen/teichoic acid export membrane protein